MHVPDTATRILGNEAAPLGRGRLPPPPQASLELIQTPGSMLCHNGIILNQFQMKSHTKEDYDRKVYRL